MMQNAECNIGVNMDAKIAGPVRAIDAVAFANSYFVGLPVLPTLASDEDTHIKKSILLHLHNGSPRQGLCYLLQLRLTSYFGHEDFNSCFHTNLQGVTYAPVLVYESRPPA